MTESDIYQLIGEAYCNGMVHGMEKVASFEKQALSPELILRAANKAIAGEKFKVADKFLAAAATRHNAAEQLAKVIEKTSKGNTVPVKMMKDRLLDIGNTLEVMGEQFYNAQPINGRVIASISPSSFNRLATATSNKITGLKWFNRSLKDLEAQFPAPEVAEKVVETVAKASPLAEALRNPVATGVAGLGLGAGGGTILGTLLGNYSSSKSTVKKASYL